MIKDGATNFVEVGPGKTLQGLIKKIDSTVDVASAI
jgi:[acyl-carrier-protein] S-malonyltransferase